MSDCPACHVKGRHLGLVIPRDPEAAVGIIHECVTPGCKILRWEERAKESIGRIANDFGRDLAVRQPSGRT